ncbi:MAG: hypothetical protein JW818_02680 [Pirellulales bacterium]|nr:hypothetical protein [Pirellulales bacterium]
MKKVDGKSLPVGPHSKDLGAQWGRAGYQLVAQRKRPRVGLGHHLHSPGRLRSIALLQNEFSQALDRCREDIKRHFGWLTSHAAGLASLPSWVRRFHRVRSWI